MILDPNNKKSLSRMKKIKKDIINKINESESYLIITVKDSDTIVFGQSMNPTHSIEMMKLYTRITKTINSIPLVSAILADNRERKEKEKMLGYCIKCKKKTELVDGQMGHYKNGTPVERGICSICKSKISRILTREERKELEHRRNNGEVI